MARLYKIVPISQFENDTLTVAMSDPQNLQRSTTCGTSSATDVKAVVVATEADR